MITHNSHHRAGADAGGSSVATGVALGVGSVLGRGVADDVGVALDEGAGDAGATTARVPTPDKLRHRQPSTESRQASTRFTLLRSLPASMATSKRVTPSSR